MPRKKSAPKLAELASRSLPEQWLHAQFGPACGADPAAWFAVAQMQSLASPHGEPKPVAGRGWRGVAGPLAYKPAHLRAAAEHSFRDVVAVVLDRLEQAVTTGDATALRRLADVAEEMHGRHAADPVLAAVIGLQEGGALTGIRRRPVNDGELVRQLEARGVKTTLRRVIRARQDLGIPAAAKPGRPRKQSG